MEPSPPTSSPPSMKAAPPPPPPTRSAWHKFQPVFFNPSLKLTALRIALLASFITSALGSQWFEHLFEENGVKPTKSIIYVVVLAFTIWEAFQPSPHSAFKLFFFIRLVDLLLIIAEIVLLTFHAKYFKFDRWSPKSIIAVVIAIWTLIVCLIFLALCRVVAVIRKLGANLLKPFDLLEDSQRMKGLPIKNSPAAASILLGRSIWRTRFPGESTAIRLFRGILGGSFILLMVIYGIINVAIYPVRETALTPVKEYRVEGTPFDFRLEQPVWHLAFMRPTMGAQRTDNSGNIFREAVQLKPLWDDSNLDKPECVDDPIAENFEINHVIYETIFSYCPPRNNQYGITSSVQANLPDLLVTINFTMLGLSTEPAKTNLWANAVQVMPGLVENIEYLLRTTSPISMLPGTNNLAELEMEVRQKFRYPALSGLGMFESTYSFVTPRLKSLLPEPLLVIAPNDPFIAAGSDVATLRIFLPDAISDIKIVEDYREKAVLDGFAVIGGLWTFLCAVFAIVFGISMTRIVFDMKPLSVFGIAQKFERDRIVEEYFTHYPQIRSEIDLPHRDRGLVTLFRDHLIDVELFQTYLSESEKEREKIEDAEADVDPAAIDPTLRYRI
ncbi:hypothetical protein CVT24_002956 [Panaeolus cyanescens]|uniref:Uncharacterized protein n=1 Tax=Panaeolus cyanescens TaxID=181874 RepID=A0A409VPD3_9AGAR|nr:hypothetical protein CVT24_002956 [Panaeolus cyanescens]